MNEYTNFIRKFRINSCRADISKGPSPSQLPAYKKENTKKNTKMTHRNTN